MENKISRRDFLKGAGAVAAGVALSNVELKAEAANPSFNDVFISLSYTGLCRNCLAGE